MTGKEEIEQEVRECLHWAVDAFAKSAVPISSIDQVNRGLGRALHPLVTGALTTDARQRIRNLLSVYKFTVHNLVK